MRDENPSQSGSGGTILLSQLPARCNLPRFDQPRSAAPRAALPGAIGGATSILIAQRVSTVRGADQILVLDAGRVVGVGKHAELMETCETYREIVLSQMSLEEAK